MADKLLHSTDADLLEEIGHKIGQLNRSLVVDPKMARIEDILTDMLVFMRALHMRTVLQKNAVMELHNRLERVEGRLINAHLRT